MNLVSDLKPMDSLLSWRYVQLKVDAAVRSGTLCREKAHSILKDAREAYRNQVYNRYIESRKKI